jgi:arginyl-tRNA synthetase
MNTILNDLTAVFKKAFNTLGIPEDNVIITISQRPELSDYQCNSALSSANILKTSPRDIAEKIIDNIPENNIIKTVTIDGPGFINISILDNYLVQNAYSIKNIDEQLKALIKNKKKTIIDFAGPNVAKPMHVGHLRSSIIGDCLQRLHKKLDIETISINHLGDYGTQIGMILYGIREKYPELPHFKASTETDTLPTCTITIEEVEKIYPDVSKRSKDDSEILKAAQEYIRSLQKGHFGLGVLWQHIITLSKTELQKDFALLDIGFDHWIGESYYHTYIPQIINDLTEKGIAVESDNALIISLDDVQNQKIPPLLLRKSDGAYLYSTTDLSAIIVRHNKYDMQKILYVVDKRQSLHFKQVFSAIEKVDPKYKDIELKHIAFGTINGKDNKPYKTRDGGVMRLHDLITLTIEKAENRMNENKIASQLSVIDKKNIAAMIGVASLKFADLVNNRETDYIFDIDSFTKFEGKTGPYIIYTAVRIRSILKKAEEQGLSAGDLIINSDIERQILLKSIMVYDVLISTYKAKAPHVLCEYIFEYSQLFNQFYNSFNIINETDAEKQQSWLTLVYICQMLFECLLDILGIKIPDKM